MKDTFSKTEGTGVSAAGVGVKTAKLTKPAIVPSWTKDLTFEIYSKQLHNWTDILEDIPEIVKFKDLIESLKNNKEIKGLPQYIGEKDQPNYETNP